MDVADIVKVRNEEGFKMEYIHGAESVYLDLVVMASTIAVDRFQININILAVEVESRKEVCEVQEVITKSGL